MEAGHAHAARRVGARLAPRRARGWRRDYVALTKPRVISLLLRDDGGDDVRRRPAAPASA